jgi:predicted DNA-binding transcriptional regulator AlpA
MSSRFVRFRDLKARGIVDSWPQLDNLIKKYGFPRGRMLSPNVRAWDEGKEVEPWPAARPVAGPPPRGAAKVAKDRPPEDRRRKAADEVHPPNDLSPASS